jgi:hypothetical protein
MKAFWRLRTATMVAALVLASWFQPAADAAPLTFSISGHVSAVIDPFNLIGSSIAVGGGTAPTAPQDGSWSPSTVCTSRSRAASSSS